MVRRLLLGILLLASTSVLPSWAAWAREQPPVKIVNGSNEPGYPSVGWFQSAGGLCTVTLIGCQTALTAAHCVCTDPTTGEELAPAECASAGFLGTADKAVFFHDAGVFAVSSVVVHPQRNPGNETSAPLHDLAVIRLASPVTGIAPAVINQNAAIASGATGTIVGFGLTSGSASDLGIKRSGAITTSPCDIPGHVCWEFSGSQSNTCVGDSGGPLFVSTAQGLVLAGVTSFGRRASCLATDFSYDADVFSDRDWILSAAGADLATGPVQCSALPNAGAVNTSVLGRVDFVVSQVTSTPVTVPAGTTQLRVGTSSGHPLQTLLTEPAGTTTLCSSGIPVGYCEVDNPARGSYKVTVRNLGVGPAEVQTVFFLLGGALGTEDPEPAPPAGPWLTTSQLPGYRFKVRINGAAAGTQVADCVPETLCVAGALPTRTELFLRVIGPRPNGFLWTQAVRFSVSRLEIWVERPATSEIRYYDLPAVSADSDTLPGMVDRTAFTP